MIYLFIWLLSILRREKKPEPHKDFWDTYNADGSRAVDHRGKPRKPVSELDEIIHSDWYSPKKKK